MELIARLPMVINFSVQNQPLLSLFTFARSNKLMNCLCWVTELHIYLSFSRLKLPQLPILLYHLVFTISTLEMINFSALLTRLRLCDPNQAYRIVPHMLVYNWCTYQYSLYWCTIARDEIWVTKQSTVRYWMWSRAWQQCCTCYCSLFLRFPPFSTDGSSADCLRRTPSHILTSERWCVVYQKRIQLRQTYTAISLTWPNMYCISAETLAVGVGAWIELLLCHTAVHNKRTPRVCSSCPIFVVVTWPFQSY